jgi:hypothetical protein
MYIKRNAHDEIEAISRTRMEGFVEPLPVTSPELKRFLALENSGNGFLALSDIELVRVLEDLIELLVSKEVIHFTDLPEMARNKLLTRRQTRVKLDNVLNLLEKEGEDSLL